MLSDTLFKNYILKYGLILGILGALLDSIYSYLHLPYTVSYILPLVLSLFLIFFFYLFKKNVNSTLIALLTISSVFIEIILKEQYTEVSIGIYFWIYIFPISIFAFFTPLISLLLNIFFISIFIFIHYDQEIIINKDYFFFPLLLSYIILTIFNFIYRRYQNGQSRELEEKKNALKDLNYSLEQRIKEAIKENNSKDKLLQQQAKLAQMGELLSMISHQYRQPLGSISAATISIKTKIALEKYDLSKEDEREDFLSYLLERLDNIENYTTSLSNTIDDFKNFYNPNKILIKANIVDSLEKSCSIMQNSFDKEHIAIEKNYHDTYIFKHHPNELMQVLLNILHNAIGNFKEKGTKDAKITIRIEDHNENLLIEICDNGGGIPEDIIEKIFDPYFSTKEEKNGTGLGLYMSKTIIEEHHQGKLIVSNKNGGACFSITLPKNLT